jgi:hypothetical protein
MEPHTDFSEGSAQKNFDASSFDEHGDGLQEVDDCPVANEERKDTLRDLEESFQRNLSVGQSFRRPPPSRQRSSGALSRGGQVRGLQRAQSMRASHTGMGGGLGVSSLSSSSNRKAPSRRAPPRTKSSDSLRPFRRDQVLVNASISDMARTNSGSLAGMAKAAAMMRGTSAAEESSGPRRAPPRRMISRSKSSDEASVGSVLSDLDSCFTMDDSVMLRKTQLVADPVLDGASYLGDEVSYAQHDDDDYSQATHFSEIAPGQFKPGQVVISGIGGSRHNRGGRRQPRLTSDDYDQAFDGASVCSQVSFSTMNSADTTDDMMSQLDDDGIGFEDDGLFDLTENAEDFADDLDELPEEGSEDEASSTAKAL